MDHLGLTVNRLIRISFGPFILGDLEPGQIEEVKTSVLKDQLGPRLSRQLGVKREPLREEKKLGPTRGKPTYLRRKPGTPPRPERLEEDRPLKRRRILPMDGTEAPKIEFVPEKKPSVGRFGRGGARDERPRREGLESRPDLPRGERPPRRDDTRIGGEASARPGREFSRDRADRPEDAASGHGKPVSERGDRTRFDRKERGGSWTGTAPRRSDRGEGERPSFSRRNEGAPDAQRPDRTFSGERQDDRPQSRFRRDGNESATEHRAPRARPPFRSERRNGEDAGGRAQTRQPRARHSFGTGSDRRGDQRGDRKPFSRPEGAEIRGPADTRGPRDRPSFRTRTDGPRDRGEDRKPFKRPERVESSGTAESRPPRDRPSFRTGSDRPRDQREDRKPFKRREGDASRGAAGRDKQGDRPSFRGDRSKGHHGERR